MPGIMPVSMQDVLYRGKSGLRKKTIRFIKKGLCMQPFFTDLERIYL